VRRFKAKLVQPSSAGKPTAFTKSKLPHHNTLFLIHKANIAMKNPETSEASGFDEDDANKAIFLACSR
jgi:hypothetical protein